MELVLSVRGFSNLVLGAPKDFFGEFFAHVRDHFIPHHRNNYHPHFLSNRSTALLTLLLMTVKIFSISYLSLSPAQSVYSSAITGENVINLTNESRRIFGLAPLKSSQILAAAAQKKAEDMVSKGYFSHNSPDGRTPWDFIKATGYEYLMAGENLAVNFSQAETVNEAWMNSASHKANILNRHFEEIGIGIASGMYANKDSIFVVQMFAVPTEEQITLKAETTFVQTAHVPMPPQVVAKELPSLQIEQADVTVDNGILKITVKTSVDIVKVLAIFGRKAVRFDPKNDGVWTAAVPIDALTDFGSELRLLAADIEGQKAIKPLAAFSDSPVANYYFAGQGQVAGKTIQILGQPWQVDDLQHRVYLLVVTAVLTCLVLAIAIKRHVQHVGAIANGSFVAILAILLWMG